MAQNEEEKVESMRLVISWVKEVREREESKKRCKILVWTAREVVVSSPDKEPPGKVEVLGEVLRSHVAWGPGRWLAMWLGTQRQQCRRLRLGHHQHSLRGNLERQKVADRREHRVTTTGRSKETRNEQRTQVGMSVI